MKKKSLVYSFAAFIVAMFIAIPARAENDGEPIKGFGISLGWKSFDLKGTTFSHDTHPQDSSMPGSNIPGSAGSTSLEGTLANNFGAIGLKYQAPITFISPNLTYNIGIGALAGGNRDRHKNDNDSRPGENASFVYSEAGPFGAYGELGLAYHVKRFYIGVEGQVAGIPVDHGWDRWGSDESVKSEFRTIPSVGPKAGWQFSENFSSDLSVQFGNGMSFAFSISAWF